MRSPHPYMTIIGWSQVAAGSLGRARTVSWPKPIWSALLIHKTCLTLQTIQFGAFWPAGNSLCQAEGRHLL